MQQQKENRWVSPECYHTDANEVSLQSHPNSLKYSRSLYPDVECSYYEDYSIFPGLVRSSTAQVVEVMQGERQNPNQHSAAVKVDMCVCQAPCWLCILYTLIAGLANQLFRRITPTYKPEVYRTSNSPSSSCFSAWLFRNKTWIKTLRILHI